MSKTCATTFFTKCFACRAVFISQIQIRGLNSGDRSGEVVYGDQSLNLDSTVSWPTRLRDPLP